MGSKSHGGNPNSGDGASPGKIFIGGLAKDTTYTTFTKHFGKYGEIVDSVIMKDRFTGTPRGFGFITYAEPAVVDKVIEETHVINGKQVEIKRTIPKGQGHSKDFRTKKIFVGGIPSAVLEDALKNFFSKYGEVVEHQIIQVEIKKAEPKKSSNPPPASAYDLRDDKEFLMDHPGATPRSTAQGEELKKTIVAAVYIECN